MALSLDDDLDGKRDVPVLLYEGSMGNYSSFTYIAFTT